MTIDKDVWAGLFFMGLAALGLWIGADYAFGTPARMGAGFLPKLLCWMMLGLGALITLIGIVRRGEPMEAWAWGQLLAILAAVLVFGAALEVLGLEFAILGAVLVGGIAEPEPKRHERWLLTAIAIGLAIFLWPGAIRRIGAVTGGSWVGNGLIFATCAAVVLAVLSHARSVAVPVMLERIALALGLGVASIVVFVDGLGLTMKSVFVMDVWTTIKAFLIKPLIR